MHDTDIPRQKPVILIVDDTPINIHVLIEALEHDYDLKIATDGRIALGLANQSSRPDLILLDIMMPEIDGYEVCRRLRASEETRDIPIIFVTAKGEAEDEEFGLSLGAVDYITKPYKIAIVKARIKSHLLIKAQRDQLTKQRNDLQKALDEIHELRGILPICSFCKKIRDDKGYWNQIEAYITKHAGILFSHSLCPDCIAKHYPGLLDKSK